jgi:hypothetical protein
MQHRTEALSLERFSLTFGTSLCVHAHEQNLWIRSSFNRTEAETRIQSHGRFVIAIYAQRNGARPRGAKCRGHELRAQKATEPRASECGRDDDSSQMYGAWIVNPMLAKGMWNAVAFSEKVTLLARDR